MERADDGHKSWSSVKSDNSWNGIKIPASGTYSFEPKMGGKLQFDVMVEDTDGRSAHVTSKEIKVEATDEYGPITANIAVDKETLGTGETVTATYEIAGGNGSYSLIQLERKELIDGNKLWAAVKNDNSWNGIKIPASGTYSFEPKMKGILRFDLMVEDTDGRALHVQTEDIKVK